MNTGNLKLLAKVLEDVPPGRRHVQSSWVLFDLADTDSVTLGWRALKGSSAEMRCLEATSCGTSACTAGHGALSDVPELAKREGEEWEDYITRVYGTRPGSIAGEFAFGANWRNDTPALARARVDYLVVHGCAPPGKEWGDWGDRPGHLVPGDTVPATPAGGTER